MRQCCQPQRQPLTTVWRHVLCALLLTGAACAENNQSYVITHFLQTLPDDMHNCSYDPTSQSGFTDSGLFDVAVAQSFSNGFMLHPVVQNNLPPRATIGEIETANIYGTGFDVELRFPSSFFTSAAEQAQLNTAFHIGTAQALNKFNVTVSVGDIPPGGGAATANVEAIPAQLASTLEPFITGVAPTMIVAIRPIGTSSNDVIVGGFVEFPVKLCKNCLVESPIPACPAAGYPEAQIQTGGCNIEQDLPTTCCTQGGATLCGTAVPQMTAAM